MPRKPGKGLLVFEELNRCERYMRSPCLQLLTARSLNDYHLPDGYLPMACINPPDEDYEVEALDSALLSRFVQVSVVPDVEQWLQWARTTDIHRAVLQYVAGDKTIFAEPQCNPRAWHYISNLLHGAAIAESSQESLRVAIMGLIGEKRATAFLSVIKGGTQSLGAQEIFSGYRKYRMHLKSLIQTGQIDRVKALRAPKTMTRVGKATRIRMPLT
ncbi:MAG: hypothetical protein K2R98_15840 [Gemmataceae bacterium]|nr:hypothetical protein [Gemmataceae bacterium]